MPAPVKPLTSLADLVPDPRNANVGTERGLAMLEQSLRETGAGRSILVDRQGRVIAGNKTLEQWAHLAPEAAISVVQTDGQTLVVVQRSDLDLDDPTGMARKLAYYDNRTSEIDLTWNPEEVLRDVDAGLDLRAMWTETELEELLADVRSGGGGETEPPEPEIDRAEELRKQWGVEVGQLWQLGRHRVLCGDCRVPEMIDRVMQGSSPQMVIADPPYGVSIVVPNEPVAERVKFLSTKKPGYGSIGVPGIPSKHPLKHDNRAGPIAVGKYAPVIGDETTETAVKTALCFLQRYPHAVHIWWGGNYYASALPDSSCWLVWDKETTGNFADCELAWTNQPRAARLFHHRWNGMLRESEPQRRWHPTQKPAALMTWAYEMLGAVDDVILDPFLGSGPTVVAGEQTGRSVYGLDLSPAYIAVTIQRWVDMTGGTPHVVEGAV